MSGFFIPHDSPNHPDNRQSPFIGIFPGTRKVYVTALGVRLFNAQWPCSKLRPTRGYWFEFDDDGELIDTDCPEHDDGPEAAAMAGDCLEFLDGDKMPAWLEG